MDLRASDFEITDDGARRNIATFTAVSAASQPGPPRNPSEARTTVAPAPSSTPGTPGRVVVVVLDDLHVAATNTPRVTASVRTFLETVVSPADSIAVVFTSGTDGGGRDFTSDPQLVRKAVNRFHGQKLRSATVERLQDPRLNFRGVLDPNADPDQPERANRARISLDALRKIGEALSV